MTVEGAEFVTTEPIWCADRGCYRYANHDGPCLPLSAALRLVARYQERNRKDERDG